MLQKVKLRPREQQELEKGPLGVVDIACTSHPVVTCVSYVGWKCFYYHPFLLLLCCLVLSYTLLFSLPEAVSEVNSLFEGNLLFNYCWKIFSIGGILWNSLKRKDELSFSSDENGSLDSLSPLCLCCPENTCYLVDAQLSICEWKDERFLGVRAWVRPSVYLSAFKQERSFTKWFQEWAVGSDSKPIPCFCH